MLNMADPAKVKQAFKFYFQPYDLQVLIIVTFYFINLTKLKIMFPQLEMNGPCRELCHRAVALQKLLIPPVISIYEQHGTTQCRAACKLLVSHSMKRR